MVKYDEKLIRKELGKLNSLLDNFISKYISIENFIKKYMNLWKHWRDNDTFTLTYYSKFIDKLFTDCDIFESNPQLRRKHNINENQLRKFAKIAKIELKKFLNKKRIKLSPIKTKLVNWKSISGKGKPYETYLYLKLQDGRIIRLFDSLFLIGKGEVGKFKKIMINLFVPKIVKSKKRKKEIIISEDKNPKSVPTNIIVCGQIVYINHFDDGTQEDLVIDAGMGHIVVDVNNRKAKYNLGEYILAKNGRSDLLEVID